MNNKQQREAHSLGVHIMLKTNVIMQVFKYYFSKFQEFRRLYTTNFTYK